MTNKPERSVKQIVKEFVPDPSFSSSDSFGVYLRITDRELTQTLEAERQRCDEVVEAERDRIAERIWEVGDYVAVYFIDQSDANEDPKGIDAAYEP